MDIFGLWRTCGSGEIDQCRFPWRGIGLCVVGRGFHGPRQNVILSTAATATALDVGRSNAALVFLAAFMGAVNGWVASETVIGGGLLR